MSLLVDTSVWVDHLRRGNQELSDLLNRGVVVCHHHVIGELACGGLRNRREILALLLDLPRAPEADFEEVFVLVEQQKLFGQGLGWVDLHLLASALLAAIPLWTLDQRLDAAARSLGCSWGPAG